MPADLYGFEAVLCADLLEELQSPSSVLMRMGGELGLVKRGGVLLLTSTYNYNDQTTPVEAWIGNSGDKHTEGTENAKSLQRIATILGPEFELIAEHNIPRVERVSDRQYVTLSPTPRPGSVAKRPWKVRVVRAPYEFWDRGHSSSMISVINGHLKCAAPAVVTPKTYRCSTYHM